MKVISNSWGCDGCSTDPNMDNTLQAGAATGQTFYFSSGDSGASVGRSRPADSPYVTAVGGTNLTTDGSGNWSSENAWSGSGGGCENGYTATLVADRNRQPARLALDRLHRSRRAGRGRRRGYRNVPVSSTGPRRAAQAGRASRRRSGQRRR